MNLVIDLGSCWLCQCGAETTEPESPRVEQSLLETEGLHQRAINQPQSRKTRVVEAPVFVPVDGSISPPASLVSSSDEPVDPGGCTLHDATAGE